KQDALRCGIMAVVGRCRRHGLSPPWSTSFMLDCFWKRSVPTAACLWNQPASIVSIHSERGTERVQTLRAAFWETVKILDGHRLKFVEEAGATLAMIRRYGRATPGQRVVDHVPDNYGHNYTMLAAMGLDGLHAPWVVDGAVNGDIFRWWVRDILGPTLR